MEVMRACAYPIARQADTNGSVPRSLRQRTHNSACSSSASSSKLRVQLDRGWSLIRGALARADVGPAAGVATGCGWRRSLLASRLASSTGTSLSVSSNGSSLRHDKDGLVVRRVGRTVVEERRCCVDLHGESGFPAAASVGRFSPRLYSSSAECCTRALQAPMAVSHLRGKLP